MKIDHNAINEYKKITAQRYVNGLDKIQLPPGVLAEKVLNIPDVKRILLEAEIKYGK